MTVQVINKDGKELMPCSNAIARLLLKQGKATVKHKKPFTIKLSYLATSHWQALPGGCVQNKLTRKNFI
jgi:hypothetical protein